MKKKLLFITSRYLWPIDGGRKASLNSYCKWLYDNYNYEIYIFCFMESGQKFNQEDLPYYIRDVTVANDINLFIKGFNILTKSLSLSKWPFQCALYYSKQNAKIIKELVNEIKPNLIITEMIRTSMYFNVFKDSDAKIISNLDDLLSNRYLRQARSKISKANIAGAYSEKLPKCVGDFIHNDILRKRILLAESKRCKIWEQKFYELYDSVLFTSDIERDAINKTLNKNKAFTLSVGIDFDYYSEKLSYDKDIRGLSYVGNFSVATNVDTLAMIIEQVLPQIKLEYRFYVIGKCPPNIIEKYKKNNKVIFCGRVEDLRYYVKRTQVFLAPIAYGTGIKTKIVEAMAMGVPVVTNSVGAEGIIAKNGEHFFVEEAYEDIAKCVDILLSNKEIHDKMSIKGQNFAKEHFSWEKVLKVFDDLKL